MTAPAAQPAGLGGVRSLVSILETVGFLIAAIIEGIHGNVPLTTAFSAAVMHGLNHP